MTLNVRNLEWLRGQKEWTPETGARLHEMMTDMLKGHNILEQQTNSNFNGEPAPPPAIQRMSVTPTEVGHHVSITHEGDFYRGIHYHVEASDNPHFTNPYPVYTGPAREMDLATGSKTLYFQAFASYGNSGNTSTVYHGGSVPQPVKGGTIGRAGPSQGSGTGRPGQGQSGFGPIPWRGNNPPVRSKS